jgi:3-phenylpropionate/trans-cinnamate dioxygenase ferredoxin reductase subunit
MADSRAYVIVGGGMAGAKAAETLREEGFDGRVIIVAGESAPPYERPPLSKDYLRGESPAEQAYVQPADYWAEHDVELLGGTVAVAIDRSAREVELGDGRRLGYERLLLATGAIPRRPPIPGAELDGVHTLRTLEDSDRLRALASAGGPLVLIGAGWIGCEVAASARQLGAEVTLVDQVQAPLENVLGAEIGGWFGALHRSHGVTLKLGAGVARLEGDGRVERVTLTDGTTIDAAAAVIGVGVAPDTRLAEAAGLEVENGIVVDERLRTGDEAIFAAGDVAAAWHPRYGRRVRVEHWSNALNQGPAAALSMLDRGAPYDRVPYFFSDQYDAGMEYAGLHAPGDRLVIRGSLDDSAFQAFWLDAADRVTAGMHVNDWDAIETINGLVEGGEAVDPASLTSA